MHRALPLLAVLLVAAPAAAGKKKSKKPGSIQGVVTTTLSTQGAGKHEANDEYCASQPGEPNLIIDEKHQVKGVYVRIKNGTFPAESTPPADPIVITQSKCEYSPRVVGVIAGQKLEIHNDDPTFHNVRIVDTDDRKVLVNKPQTKGAAPITTDALAGEGIVSLHCDVHPWMQSFAVLSDHPHFTFTDAKGRFELKGLPPGTYTVEAWGGPTLGWQTKKVKVKAGKKAKAKFHYDLDDCGGC